MKPDSKGSWIALYTKTLYSETFNRLSCAERSVFLQCFFLAARMEYDCAYNGRFYHLLPGQFVISQRDLAKQCGEGCTRQIVRGAISKLVDLKTITHSRPQSGTQSPSLITFINWSVYQHTPKLTTQSRTQSTTQLQPSDTLQQLMNGGENAPYKVGTVLKEGLVQKTEMSPEVSEVLAYLNEKVKRNFKNPGDIPARLKDYSVEDCKTVIDKKCLEWLGTDLSRHLDPVTLFRPANFDRYLNQVEVSRETMTFREWVALNPTFDFLRFTDEYAKADAFQRAIKEAKRDPRVKFTDDDFAMLHTATRIKTREAQDDMREAKR